MMKVLRSFLVFPVTVILLLTAFDFAASGLWRLPPHPVLVLLYRWGATPEGLARYARLFWILAGALVLAIWLLTIFLWRRRSRPLHVRSLAGETVLIHPGALLKFVRLQVEEHPAVVAQRARVRQRPTGGIGVWVMAMVRPVDALPNIKRQIEDKIRTGLTQVLGIERVDELTIVISLDEKSLNYRPGPPGAPEPKPEPPIRAPLDEEPVEPGPAAQAPANNGQPTNHAQPTADIEHRFLTLTEEETNDHERKNL